jgi:hypothetical protein
MEQLLYQEAKVKSNDVCIPKLGIIGIESEVYA